MHELDRRMTQCQKISQISDSSGEHIHSMTNEELVELELDPEANLDSGTFRIVDIRGEQYGKGVQDLSYTGIFPVIVTAPMALYYHEKIENSTELDSALSMIDVSDGMEMSTDWFKEADPTEEEFKIVQSEIFSGIDQLINFNTKGNKFHRADSFQDMCVKKFPKVNMLEPGKLDRTHTDEIGILLLQISE